MEHHFENLPLVLVSGQARSGTTVLTHAIGAHPRICSNLKESSIVDDCAFMLRRNLERPGRLADLSVSPAQLTLNARRFLLHSLFPLPFQSDQQSIPNGLPVEERSTPLAISTFSSLRLENLDTIAKLFPSLVIVNIFRNGIEVVASRMTHSNIGKNFSFEQHCVAWSHARDAIQWGGNKPFFVPVPHHELLQRKSTDTIFQSALEKVGIVDNVEFCTEFVHSQIINVNNSPELSGDAGRRSVAFSQRVERWRNWNQNQREVFEQICGETMELLGFEIPWKTEKRSHAS